MGMQKSIETSFGNIASYWNIGNVTYNKIQGNIQITVNGFINQKTRLSGAMPILTRHYALLPTGTSVLSVDIANINADAMLKRIYTILTTATVPPNIRQAEPEIDPITGKIIEEPPLTDVPFCEFYGAKKE